MSNDIIIHGSVTKTFVLGAIAIVLGFLFFLFKVDACKYNPKDCQDRFIIAYQGTHGTHDTYDCPRGSSLELRSVVNGKDEGIGMVCHCNRPSSDGGSHE